MDHLLIANTNLSIKLKMLISSNCCCVISCISKKAYFEIYLLLLSRVTNFIKRKIKPDQVYEIKKPYIHYLLKANINLDMKLKMYTSSDYH